jgi:uncharacterized protein (TIGR00661 family)
MKVLYGIQLTGNGHVTRSTQLINSLIQNGFDVDVITSGNNSQIKLPFKVKKHFKGLSMYYDDKGGIDWKLTFKKADIKQFFKDIKYDVTKYDMIISDFEPISAWSAKKHRIPSIGFGNQYSFLSNKLIRPSKKDKISETFLKKFAKCDYNIGISYEEIDDFIYKPIINEDLLKNQIEDNNFYLIYLPSISIDYILNEIENDFDNFNFKIYSPNIKKNSKIKNIEIKKLNKDEFQSDITKCTGIITGSGFSTTSEALILNKKLWSIPMKGQYEQLCNAIALKKMGIFTDFFTKDSLEDWINNWNKIKYNWKNPINDIIKKIIKIHEKG